MVAKLREDYFGPVGEPQELLDMKSQLNSIRQESAAANAGFDRRLAGLESKLERVCVANGWTTL